jgi:hypothetical protein
MRMVAPRMQERITEAATSAMAVASAPVRERMNPSKKIPEKIWENENGKWGWL